MRRRPTLARRLGAPPPAAHAIQLERALKPLIADVRHVLPTIRTLADVRALGAALRREWPDRRIREIVAGFGERAEAAASRPWGPLDRLAARARGDAAGRLDARPRREYDGRKLVAGWTRDATGLITSVRDEVAERLRRDVVAAAEAGEDPATLAARWIAEGVPVEWGTLEGRMRTIARHQLSTLHAQVQSERARAVGVTEAIWHHSGNTTAPRPEHVALDGVRFEYANPPASSGGLPGTLPNCGCWAESVIPDDVAELLGFVIEG